MALAQPCQASMISPAPWMRRWVPFSSYTASAANAPFALLQSLSLYAVIEAFAISITFAMVILLYKSAPVGAAYVVSEPTNGRFKVVTLAANKGSAPGDAGGFFLPADPSAAPRKATIRRLSDLDFLLYPLATEEYPTCPACG